MMIVRKRSRRLKETVKGAVSLCSISNFICIIRLTGIIKVPLVARSLLGKVVLVPGHHQVNCCAAETVQLTNEREGIQIQVLQGTSLPKNDDLLYNSDCDQNEKSTIAKKIQKVKSSICNTEVKKQLNGRCHHTTKNQKKTFPSANLFAIQKTNDAVHLVHLFFLFVFLQQL